MLSFDDLPVELIDAIVNSLDPIIPSERVALATFCQTCKLLQNKCQRRLYASIGDLCWNAWIKLTRTIEDHPDVAEQTWSLVIPPSPAKTTDLVGEEEIDEDSVHARHTMLKYCLNVTNLTLVGYRLAKEDMEHC